MRLIINKPTNNKNRVVTIKTIELTSLVFNDNTVTYLVYNDEIPLIKFTDTGEIFNIKTIKKTLDQSTNEAVLIINLSDLELIISNNSEGGGVGTYSKKSDIVNTLESTETDKPLSANQGRVINDKIKIDSSVVPYAYANGEVLNGATAVTNGFTVPIGQTGNSTYFRILKLISGVNADNYVGRTIEINFTVTIENYSQIIGSLGDFRLFRMQGSTLISTSVLPTTINFVDVNNANIKTRNITATYVMNQSDIDNLYWYNFLFQIHNSNAVASIVKYTSSNILVAYSNIINKVVKNNTEKLTDLTERVEEIEARGVTVVDIDNGVPIVFGNVSNWQGMSITERNVLLDYLVYSRSGAGNSWIYSPSFVPNGSNLVHVKFNAEIIKSGGYTGSITVRIANSTSAAGKYLFLGAITNSGDYEFTFDPSYYNVYGGFTNFYIWFLNDNMLAGQSVSLKLTGLKVFENLDSINGQNITGSNAKELFESTDAAISDINSQIVNKPPVVDSDGKKYEIGVSNGNVVAFPIIPTKGAFFGNSLLFAFSYGMAASEAQYDYYNRINTYILSKNSAYISNKETTGGAFETAETEAALVSAINGMVNSLDGDETLVSIQLGDNVNNTARNLIFNGGGCLRLLQAVREKCPLARVVWMGMWYSSVERYNTIITSCINTGSKFVSFSDLVGASSNNRIGGVHKLASSTTMTLAGVTNVVANTATNITVTFTVAGVTYISDPLDIISYSLLSGTLTYTGLWEIISNGGVASHPGDNGFRKIANKFLYEMKISDLKETYI